jgi:hypothetical protein
LLGGGVAQKRIEDLIKERGIDFELTDELRARFSKIGAGPGVIRSLEYASILSRLKRLEAAKAKADPLAKEQRKTSEAKKGSSPRPVRCAPPQPKRIRLEPRMCSQVRNLQNVSKIRKLPRSHVSKSRARVQKQTFLSIRYTRFLLI